MLASILIFIIIVVVIIMATSAGTTKYSSEHYSQRGRPRPARDLPRSVSTLQSAYSQDRPISEYATQYAYKKKYSLITSSEIEFFHMLTEVAGDRYYIFPQIHLSSLMTNETRGKYHKLSFQRINRRSVDYVLCDKQTFKPVYAVELDDASHDLPARRARDAMIEQIFTDIQLPLVRFRNYRNLSQEAIARRFYEARM